MKKLILIAVLFITSCAAPLDKTKFKNPIFYQKLEAYSKVSHNTQLTPTSLIDLDFPEANPDEPCELLEDNVSNILMECSYINKSFGKITYYIRFTSTGSTKLLYDYCFVRKEVYDDLEMVSENNPFATMFYAINPKKIGGLWSD